MQLEKFKSILDLLKKFPNEQSCMDYLTEIRWRGNVISPFDPTSRVYKCKLNRFKCKNTGKYFNAKTGTIFEDTKIPLQKWFIANYLFSSHKKGISSHQLGRDLDITQKTAWFMLHRLRVAFKQDPVILSGHVEVDETYIGPNQHWRHQSQKKRSERGHVINAKTPVLGMLQRGGLVVAYSLPNITGIANIVRKHVKKKSTISTDTLYNYNSLRDDYTHLKINHSVGKFVRDGASTNCLENFWSHLKRGIYGIYHRASFKHLQAYVDEFVLRFNTRKFTTSDRFDLILGKMATRLTYAQLIEKK